LRFSNPDIPVMQNVAPAPDCPCILYHTDRHIRFKPQAAEWFQFCASGGTHKRPSFTAASQIPPENRLHRTLPKRFVVVNLSI
jgi:hypothetical protein